jgi:hypothetical protein
MHKQLPTPMMQRAGVWLAALIIFTAPALAGRGIDALIGR